jgi:epoxyqueuosine reductase
MNKVLADPVAAITGHALALGFDAIGFARAELSVESRGHLREFLVQGRHGSMGWLAARETERGDPQTLWPDAKSVILLGLSYAPSQDPLAGLAQKSTGNISVYARNRDYHDVFKGKLKHLAQLLIKNFGGDVKVFVDTAPVLEKTLAAQAALGWQGKHTNLVSRTHGSWLFLGEIFTTLDLPPSPPRAGACGSCEACLTICPTQAFPAPYQLDARRCISYLTIEHDGPIPEEFRPAIGNRIYGCDDCLAVCPWNKFATSARTQKFWAREDLIAPSLAELAQLDDKGFREKFSGSPIKRIGHKRFLRNVLIAIGNAGDSALRTAVELHLHASDPVIAEAAAWALARLPC